MLQARLVGSVVPPWLRQQFHIPEDAKAPAQARTLDCWHSHPYLLISIKPCPSPGPGPRAWVPELAPGPWGLGRRSPGYRAPDSGPGPRTLCAAFRAHLRRVQDRSLGPGSQEAGPGPNLGLEPRAPDSCRGPGFWTSGPGAPYPRPRTAACGPMTRAHISSP